MKILTTGVLSGLGKYVHENFGDIGLTRQTSYKCLEKVKETGVEVIIHCAFNSNRDITSDSLYQYLEDNVLLTKKLVSLPHKKFIFISSVDVYPSDDLIHSEEKPINLDSINKIYGITKLMSESIVKKHCKNNLILRPTSLLGEYSKKNTLLKIISGDKEIGLSEKSVYNYILYSDVLDFIKFSMENNLEGTFNMASSNNIFLSEVADILGKNIQFGTHTYNVGKISNKKISSLFPVFRKTSLEVLNQYLNELKK